MPDSIKNSKEQNQQLQTLVATTLMGVLAALYESNIVKRVNMGKVVQLFGLDDTDLNDIWIDFSDPEFLIGYNNYKLKQSLAITVNEQKKNVSDKLEKYFDDPNRTLH